MSVSELQKPHSPLIPLILFLVLLIYTYPFSSMVTTEHNCPLSDDNEKNQRTELVQRAQWLRAAILGANDGLLSTTSLMLGVSAAKEDRWSMVLSGLAGALAGACSMAVGEFVSVSTQRDIELATTINSKISKNESFGHVENGHEVKIDISNVNVPAMSPAPTSASGEPPSEKKMDDDDDDDNDDGVLLPDPYKAAAASALAFLCGSFVPLVPAIFIARNIARIVVIVVVTSIALTVFGGMGARLGGSPVRVSALRVLVGGLIAMGITYGLLKPFDRDDF